jgi:phosphomannomutase
MNTRAFKAYDIRGRVPEDLDEDLANAVGRSMAEVICPQGGKIIVGQDVRPTSEALANALESGLTAAGLDVIRIGLCGTEEVYFATAHLEAAGGVMITASHNPRGYNGMKLVRENSRPISGDTGLLDIAARAMAGGFVDAPTAGSVTQVNTRPDFIKHLLGYVNVEQLKPLKIVVNPGNGCAGPAIDAIAPHLPFELIRVQFEPDGSFPNGIPNPLLPEKRADTANAVIAHGAHLGVAFDGDFDRCFLFDESGRFIEGYYIVGLLAERLLRTQPEGTRVVHDPRLTWNTVEMVQAAGGEAVQCKSGHAFIKERMRQEDAVYGGEMSAHHYFRDFFYADSGMIPWLLVAQAICLDGPLSTQVSARMAKFPASGEINRRIPDPEGALRAMEARYPGEVDKTDGLSVDLGSWRFNLRKSNTEPLIRLNVESRGDEPLMRDKTAEILDFLAKLGAHP